MVINRAHDPLIDVARQMDVVRQVKQHITLLPTMRSATRIQKSDFRPLASRPPILIGTAYSYLQEYLPHVAQYVVRNGWTDMVGLGRMVLSYPGISRRCGGERGTDTKADLPHVQRLHDCAA